ncbi:hypothetical protein E2P81_ATG07976 [Venturia nashicola]|nr:hypothetical protein E2P81_ATG07976 [Venturia nashicola]
MRDWRPSPTLPHISLLAKTVNIVSIDIRSEKQHHLRMVECVTPHAKAASGNGTPRIRIVCSETNHSLLQCMQQEMRPALFRSNSLLFTF